MGKNLSETEQLAQDLPNEGNISTTLVTVGVEDGSGRVRVQQNQSVTEGIRDKHLRAILMDSDKYIHENRNGDEEYCMVGEEEFVSEWRNAIHNGYDNGFNRRNGKNHLG